MKIFRENSNDYNMTVRSGPSVAKYDRIVCEKPEYSNNNTPPLYEALASAAMQRLLYRIEYEMNVIVMLR